MGDHGEGVPGRAAEIGTPDRHIHVRGGADEAHKPIETHHAAHGQLRYYHQDLVVG